MKERWGLSCMIVRLGCISRPGEGFGRGVAVTAGLRALWCGGGGFGAATQPRSPARGWRWTATLEMLCVEWP